MVCSKIILMMMTMILMVKVESKCMTVDEDDDKL